jgi:hypothetical protein
MCGPFYSSRVTINLDKYYLSTICAVHLQSKKNFVGGQKKDCGNRAGIKGFSAVKGKKATA